MGQASFTLDELLAYLGAAEGPAEGFRTAREWGAELGVTYEAAKDLVREGLTRGVVKRQKDRRVGIDGVRRPVPVYAFELPDGVSHSDSALQ